MTEQDKASAPKTNSKEGTGKPELQAVETQDTKKKMLEKTAEVKDKAVSKAGKIEEKVTAKTEQVEPKLDQLKQATSETKEPEYVEVEPMVVEPLQAKENTAPKTPDKHLSVQDKLTQLKQELLQRLDELKGLKGADLSELSAFVKAEFSAVIEDLSKLGKELKQDVSEISLKHKGQLTETFKRSKEHTLEAFTKVAKIELKDEPKPKI